MTLQCKLVGGSGHGHLFSLEEFQESVDFFPPFTHTACIDLKTRILGMVATRYHYYAEVPTTGLLIFKER